MKTTSSSIHAPDPGSKLFTTPTDFALLGRREMRWLIPMSDSESRTHDELLIELYRSTLPEIYGYLLRRVGGHRADAEELTQETYMAPAKERSCQQLSAEIRPG